MKSERAAGHKLKTFPAARAPLLLLFSLTDLSEHQLYAFELKPDWRLTRGRLLRDGEAALVNEVL
jgi:hypothetical protein